MTCLPKAFSLFSPFSFSSRYLYSAYVLFKVPSLALPTFSCVHLHPNKYALPLFMTPYQHSCFLCCSKLSLSLSTVSPKKLSSFNMFSASTIAFITCLNRHHTRNNIRYKGSIINTSVITY